MPAKQTAPFAQEPHFSHGQAPRAALLFCNLGTPASPTPADVRRFLAEFLSDARVVEIPRLLWLLILHGIILRVRPAKSAAKYASIWTPEGSPLKVWTEKQASGLQQWLTQAGHHITVRYAMRYGQTNIAEQLDALKAEGVTRVLLLPAYPQYSATTTASLFDAVYTWAAKVRNVPELRFINRYHDHPAYINALAGSIQRHWATHGRADQLVMSFHGVPERTLHLGDPYHCECLKTARLLAEALGLPRDAFKVTFQSRLGRAKWLQPYPDRPGPGRRQTRRRGLPRLHQRLPGNPGRDQHGGARGLFARRRRGVSLHPLPERRRPMDQRPGRSGPTTPGRLAHPGSARRPGTRQLAG